MKKYDLYRDEHEPDDLIARDLSKENRGYWIKISGSVYNPEDAQDRGFRWMSKLDKYPLVQRGITMEQIQRIAEYL